MIIGTYEKIVPDAFHGTSVALSKDIVNEGFKPSTGERQFLGDGVYFFESSIAHARGWARPKFHPGPIAVFRAVVNLGRCLDLHDIEHRELLRKTRDKLQQSGKKITDAFVINFVAENFHLVDSVRATFSDPKYGKLFDESKFTAHSQLIICIRNLRNILEYYLEYEES